MTRKPEPRRLCVVGNSHIGAIKLGWDSIDQRASGLSLTLFGAGGNDMLHELEIENGTLRATSRRMAERLRRGAGDDDIIDPSQHDAILLVGMELAVFTIFDIYRHYRTCSQVPLRRPMGLLSEECLRDAIDGSFDVTLALTTLRKFEAITDKPLYLLPCPLPSPAWSVRISDDERSELAGLWDAALARIPSRYRVTVLRQPQETLQPPVFTRGEFARGAMTLNGLPQPKSDVKHMNDAYGRAVIEMLARDRIGAK